MPKTIYLPVHTTLCKLFFCILYLMFNAALFAQRGEIDSLRSQLRTHENDTLRINQLNKLGFLYHTSKPDSSLILAQESLNLARANNYTKGEARALSVMSNAFYSTGNYAKSLELQINALKTYETINDLVGISNTTGNIGNIYGVIGNHTDAMRYSLKTLNIKEEISDTRGVGMALANIGKIYLNQSKLDSARHYILKSYDIALQTRDSYRKRVTSNHLGNIYYEMNEHQIALEYYRNAFDTNNTDITSLTAALGMVEIFKDRNLGDSILYYAGYVYDKAEASGITDLTHISSAFIADYYKGKQHFDSAYAYLAISLKARDTLFSQEKRNKIQALSLDEMGRQQEKEELESMLLNKQKMNLQYIGISGGIVVFVLVFLLLSRSIIVNERWLSYLGIFILLLCFEFINLYLSSYIGQVVNFSAVYTLMIMVLIAAILVPLHHRIEIYITDRMIKKNRKLKIAAAKKALNEMDSDAMEG